MDTIARHSTKLVKPYCLSSKAEAIVRSAKILARLVLTDTQIMPQHRNKFLSSVQWMISEANGKYATRYRTETVIDLAKNQPWTDTKVNHEHVYTRRHIIKLLLANPSESDQILEQVVACIVTTHEHHKLSAIPAGVVGWDRYSQAKIVVIDMFH